MSYLPVVLLPLLFHALFVAAEYAFVRAATTTQTMAVEGTQTAGYDKIFHNLEAYLQICQIGKTMAIMLFGIYLGVQLNQLGISDLLWASATDQALLLIGFLSIVAVHVVIGFEFPKMLGIARTRQCISGLTGFLLFTRILLVPLTWTVRKLTLGTAAAADQ